MFINWERAYSTHTPITIPLAGRGGSGSGGVSGVRTGAIGFDELVLIVCHEDGMDGRPASVLG